MQMKQKVEKSVNQKAKLNLMANGGRYFRQKVAENKSIKHMIFIIYPVYPHFMERNMFIKTSITF